MPTRVRVDGLGFLTWFVFLIWVWVALGSFELQKIADHLTHDCPICEPQVVRR